MLMIVILVMLIFFIIILLLFLNFFFSKKVNKNREKLTPVECGFDVMSLNRLPFSLQFYLISVIFLIFDVEISLILPLVYLNKLMYFFVIYSMVFVLVVLLLGVYLEWFEGSLSWF